MINKTILAALVIGFITAAPAPAGAQEAATQTTARTYAYDTNKDGYIQQDEFVTYLYTKSDLDGDGYMGDEEWTLTTSQYYRPYKDVNYNNYTYWDQDKDNRLDNNEVKTLIKSTGLYSKWDTNTDGKVSNDEFSIGTFNAYDDNSDGALSLAEWKNVLR